MRAALTHMRAWEVNGDGTRAGLAFTARDLDRHDPLKRRHFTGAVIDDAPGTFTLFGGLAPVHLFSGGVAYAFELWAPMEPTDECAPPRWAYFVLPMTRLVVDFTIGLDGWEYADYVHTDGCRYPSLTFTLHAGNQWGKGPHPVRLVEVGAELTPAYFDELPASCKFTYAATAMAPTTALQYTDHITHRTPARKAIT